MTVDGENLSNLHSGPRPLPKHMQGTCPSRCVDGTQYGPMHDAPCADLWHTQGTSDMEAKGWEFVDEGKVESGLVLIIRSLSERVAELERGGRL